MKTFQHRKTGEVVNYREGIVKSGRTVIHLGQEPPSEHWKEIFPQDKTDEHIKFRPLSHKKTIQELNNERKQNS